MKNLTASLIIILIVSLLLCVVVCGINESLNKELREIKCEISSEFEKGYDEGYRLGFHEGQNLQGKENHCTNCNLQFIADEEISYSFCYDCWIKEATECAFCFSSTLSWGTEPLFAVCTDCLGEALDTTELHDLLVNFNENR